MQNEISSILLLGTLSSRDIDFVMNFYENGGLRHNDLAYFHHFIQLINTNSSRIILKNIYRFSYRLKERKMPKRMKELEKRLNISVVRSM